MKLLFSIAIAGTALHATCIQVEAADFPAKAPRRFSAFDWSGFYLGSHVGCSTAALGTAANAQPSQGVFFPSSATGLIGGYQVGYNRQLQNNVVLGIELDATFTSPVDSTRLGDKAFHTTFDYLATARGRIGYAFGEWLPYATAGFAWGQTKLNLMNPDVSLEAAGHRVHVGWTAGAGVEAAVGGHWTAKIEYNYMGLSRQTYSVPGSSADFDTTPKAHLIKLGLNYRIGDLTEWSPASGLQPKPLQVSSDWNVHAQTTLIGTGYPSFRSPYEGANSLGGAAQFRETFTTTAFLGWRLWDGGEFYFNPELAQGFGFNGTLGIAGFPNGEAQKAGGAYPKLRPQRYYLRQTFGLGGEQEEVEDAANQLSGKRDIDRVTLIIGRFAIGDFFDGNSYAKDPRADFMNWAMWSSAAYDFPADLPGFTRGGVIELNRKDWAVRAGLFEVPSQPNSDVLTFKSGGAVIEFEERHQLFERPGKVRLGAFLNRGMTGNYRTAIALESASPFLDINDIMASIRKPRDKYGFYLNGEQEIADGIGVFGRASWNDGQNEILSFTDIDKSLSGGVSIKGSRWGRAKDTVGIGGAINGLSAAHRDFLAAGGTGLLIGDGRLNYGTERIVEAFYAYAIDKNFTFTADYQFIANPAYNKDRGPVSIFSGRLHGEF